MAYVKHTREEIEKVINESPDMISALEAVGAMYGIPSTHIIAQPGLKSIRVECDNIIAPTDVKPNTKAIVCAIGAVLDQISQRINDKLDHYQSNLSTKGRIDDKVSQTSNPAKGTVIAHHTLSDGSEIIVYDSGLVDMPHTDEARAKVAELRANGGIPQINIFNDSKEFTKEPYFTNDYNIGLTDTEKAQLYGNDPIPTDHATELDECDTHMEMFVQYNETDYLGYDVFREMGFDFIERTESFVSEASNNKKINVSDFKHSKFDNKEITKAIQCFNEARLEQKNKGKGKFDIKTFIDNPKYKEGVNHLQKQFDCQLSVYWHTDTENPDATTVFTSCYDMIAQKMTVSKTKGFQLAGLPIQIHILNNAIDEEMSLDTNVKLFGQFMCATLCHEIFHNIANALRLNNGIFTFTLDSAMSLAASTNSAKRKREVFDHYVATLRNGKNDPISKIQRKRLVSALCKASALAENNKALMNLKNSVTVNPNAEQEIDKLINAYSQKYKELNTVHTKMMKKGKKYNKGRATAMTVIGIILLITIIGLPIGIVMLANTGDIEYEYMKEYEKYMRTPNKEEYYCDLFAGMYNLPISFTYGYGKRNYTANMVSPEKLQQLKDLEGKVRNLKQSKYPTESERNYAAYLIAKNILEGKTAVSKEVREYCQWMVANYSNIADTDIAANYRSHVFNPKEADDLDTHLQNLINNNQINITEYAI